MIDLNKISDYYKDTIIIKHSTNEAGLEDIFLGIPFYHRFKNDEGILIRITEVNEYELILSDGHMTLDFLEEVDVDINLYSEKFEKILSLYGMYQDGNVLRKRFSYNHEGNIIHHIGYFIQGLTLIANIDI